VKLLEHHNDALCLSKQLPLFDLAKHGSLAGAVTGILWRSWQ